MPASTAATDAATPTDWAAERARYEARIAALEHQLDWFKRQLFGEKSERRQIEAPPTQRSLGEGLGAPAKDPAAKRRVGAHERRVHARPSNDDDESALFFDQRVPVETIPVPNPEMDGLEADAYEVIGEKVTHRLAQRPGSYVVLKYVRPLIKRKDDHTLHCPPAPPAGIEGGRADVSFLAGVLVDKFLYHLPLYRQHQRLTAAGIEVSRQWLTQLVLAAALLLAPIVEAQWAAIRRARVKAMDDQCAGSAFGPLLSGARRAESQDETSKPRSRPGAKAPASSSRATSGPSGAIPTTAGAVIWSSSTDPRERPALYARGWVTIQCKAPC